MSNSIAQKLFGVTSSMTPFRKFENGYDVKYSTPPTSFGGGNFDMFDEKIYQNFAADNKLTKVLKNINKYLYTGYAPDINGFSAVVFTPPPFKGLKVDNQYLNEYLKNFMVFAAIDFTPPQIQVETERVTSRNGGIPYATEVTPSEQLSITFIDDLNISIYNSQYRWVEYIRQLLDGSIEPPSEYLNYDDDNEYGVLDYAGKFTILKFDPSGTEVKFVANCYGVYPLGLPNKDIIGQRAANELTTFSINYACGFYEETTNPDHEIFQDWKG